MSQSNLYIQSFEEWYNSLKTVAVNKGPANGTIAAGLVILKSLKESYDLNFESYIAKGGMQIKGLSGSSVAEILNDFGEYRPFAKEGGRTNRGGPGEIKSLLQKLSELNLEILPEKDKNKILTSFQVYLVDRVRDYHNRQKIKLVFDHKLSTWQIVASLLETAKSEGKAGSVAQYLVGAKLQLRYPEIKISNESASTADRPTNRQGDFFVGDTVFHVTVSPMQGVYNKCVENLSQGLKVYLLVPDSKLIGARQSAEEYCGKQISVESLESFVSQNIDEISIFQSEKLKSSFVNLIRIYNERVNAVEVDKSLLIELPSNLS